MKAGALRRVGVKIILAHPSVVRNAAVGIGLIFAGLPRQHGQCAGSSYFSWWASLLSG
jgi:hypothetical protein